ncbi:MAG: ISAs1 family transposase [Verrucomicrobiales bacterium]|nr:ISAs1 family transposase [Verrucomicrobiales bacterium]
MNATIAPPSKLTEQQILDQVEIRLLDDNTEDRATYKKLINQHHYLQSDVLVGEQLRYVAVVDGQWVALLSWNAAAQHLRDREKWIGWSHQQRRRRLAFIANNSRFLILPHIKCPNLASRVLALCTSRLSSDWQQAYGHLILAVESFVDSQLFRGTCYKAQGWTLLGQTQGFERNSQDYYVEHNRPKQLWMRQLDSKACHLLSSEILPSELQPTEDKVIPRSDATVKEIRDLWQLCREVPEWRKRKGRDYPLPCLLSIMVLATMSGIIRGQRDLAAFAAKLTQAQLRALRSYPGKDGRYHAPKETTFQRVLAAVDAKSFQEVLQKWEMHQLGKQDLKNDELIAIDGKAQRGSTPHVADEQKSQLVSALSLPSRRVLATVAVEKKSNEIPAARELLTDIGELDGKLVMLDALHTNQKTLRQIYQENGADYLVPVKGNHAGLEKLAAAHISTTLPQQENDPQESGFPPLDATDTAPPSTPAVRYRRK